MYVLTARSIAPPPDVPPINSWNHRWWNWWWTNKHSAVFLPQQTEVINSCLQIIILHQQITLFYNSSCLFINSVLYYYCRCRNWGGRQLTKTDKGCWSTFGHEGKKGKTPKKSHVVNYSWEWRNGQSDEALSLYLRHHKTATCKSTTCYSLVLDSSVFGRLKTIFCSLIHVSYR